MPYLLHIEASTEQNLSMTAEQLYRGEKYSLFLGFSLVVRFLSLGKPLLYVIRNLLMENASYMTINYVAIGA